MSGTNDKHFQRCSSLSIIKYRMIVGTDTNIGALFSAIISLNLFARVLHIPVYRSSLHTIQSDNRKYKTLYLCIKFIISLTCD